LLINIIFILYEYIISNIGKTVPFKYLNKLG
jgi:hypothetical protein